MTRWMTVLVLLAAAPLAAQAPPDTPLSLTIDEAIARGLAASHRVEEAVARREAADAQVGTRRSATQPLVTALGGYTRTNHVTPFGIPVSPQTPNIVRLIYPDVPDNYRTRLDVQWPVYTGGRSESLVDAAMQEAAARGSDVEALRSDLRADIARAYWTLVVAMESERVVGESVTATSAHVQDVRNRLAAGLVPPNDVASAEAQLARQQMFSVQARSQHEVAEAELAKLIGVAPSMRLAPATPLEPHTADLSVDQLIAEALRQRQDRQALVTRIAALQAQERAASAERKPVVAIVGGVDYANPNPKIFPRTDLWQESWDAGVNVSWAIFDGHRARSDIAEAQANLRATRARLDELDSTVALEIRQRVAELTSSGAAIAAGDAAVTAAVEARRVIADRFNAGVATSTDLLDAQQVILQSSLERVQAMASARVADAQLQRALGR